MTTKQLFKKILPKTAINQYLHLKSWYGSTPYALKNKILASLTSFDLRPSPTNKLVTPKNSHIEITNSCNLNCVMCQTKESKRKVGLMKYDLFDHAVNQITASGINNVALQTVGETFIHHDLDRFVKKLHNNGIKINISTNAQFPDKLISLKENNPDAIDLYRISLESASKEMYELFRRGGKFELLIESFEKIKEYNLNNKNKINVTIKALIGEENLYDLLDIMKLQSKYDFVTGVNFNLIDKNNATNNDNGVSISLGDERKGSETSSMQLDNLFGGYEYCRQPFLGAHVTYNGDVTLCCRDYEADLVVGNIKEETLQNIWDSEKSEKLRKKFIPKEKNIVPPTRACVGCESAINGVAPLVNDYVQYIYLTKGKRLTKEEFGDAIKDFLNDLNNYSEKNKINDLSEVMKKHL